MARNISPEFGASATGVSARQGAGSASRTAALSATGQAIYAQRPRAPDAGFRAAVGGTSPVIAPLFSPLSAKRFAAALNGDRPGHLTPVALSAAVRDALPAPWRAETPVAEAPNAGEMLRAMAPRISP